MMLIYSSYRGELAVVLLIAALMGFTVQGAVCAFYGAAERSYPVEMKSTGIGWTIGVGRVGAITGHYIGGILLAMELPLPLNFLIFGTVMLIGAAVMWPLRAHRDERGQGPGTLSVYRRAAKKRSAQ